MKILRFAPVLLGLTVTAACHGSPSECEIGLKNGFIALDDPDASRTNDKANIQDIRSKMKELLSACQITGIGEPHFYPFPLSRLDFAIVAGDTELTKAIISNRDEHEGYYSTRSEMLETPLHFAAAKGTPAIVEVLLNSGFDVNSRDKLGETPLMASVAEIDRGTDNMGVLIAHGANVNMRANSGATALMFAIMDKNPETAQYLIDHGADLDTNNPTMSILDLARKTNDGRVVSVIENAMKRKN